MLKNENGYNLRSGLVLYPPQQEDIENLLMDLTRQVSAELVLLVDVTGQVISSRGNQQKINLVSLGSLVAGDMAASHEIARLTDQYEDYQMVLREGQTIHTVICEAGDYLALLVQISTEIPLGWARIAIRNTARKLVEIANKVPVEEKQSDTTLTSELSLSEKDVDLFNDALDELWLE